MGLVSVLLILLEKAQLVRIYRAARRSVLLALYLLAGSLC